MGCSHIVSTSQVREGKKLVDVETACGKSEAISDGGCGCYCKNHVPKSRQERHKARRAAWLAKTKVTREARRHALLAELKALEADLGVK